MHSEREGEVETFRKRGQKMRRWRRKNMGF